MGGGVGEGVEEREAGKEFILGHRALGSFHYEFHTPTPTPEAQSR